MKFLRLSVLAAVAALQTLSPALAQDRPSEVTAQQVTTRIDLAARQRMLLERMAKSMCFADAGVHVWDNELYLQEAYVSFAIAHRGISEGDEKLGLFREDNREFKSAWRDVDLMWSTLRRIYDDFIEREEIDSRDFANAMELTNLAHGRSNDIVAQIRASYTRYLDSGFGGSILLDLYSRQKELSQRLSKEVCLTSRGIDREENLARLNSTLNHFQVSLDAFRFGLEDVGIKPAPTERIARQLERANDRWEEVRGYAERVAAGGVLEELEMADFEFGVDIVLREVERAVFLLADHLARGS